MSTITFAGNLAADPEIQFTPSGRQVARLTVIENRRRRTEHGSGWEDAEPNVYRVQCWQQLAEHVAESCTKGDRVLVSGSIRTDRWTDKETKEDRTGQHVVADEVAFSLRFHTVKATKATRAASSEDSGQWSTEEPPF